MFKLLDNEPKEDVQAALDELKQDYERPGGLQLVEVAGGYQIVTRPDLHEWVRRLFHERSAQKLSVQALETLAVIAYRQPITALEITEIRGVNTVRRAQHAARASPDQDRRPQAGRRPAVHVRDDEGIPDPLRAERSERPAEGRGHGRGARHRGAAARRTRRRPRSSCRSRNRRPNSRSSRSTIPMTTAPLNGSGLDSLTHGRRGRGSLGARLIAARSRAVAALRAPPLRPPSDRASARSRAAYRAAGRSRRASGGRPGGRSRRTSSAPGGSALRGS